MKKTGQFSWNFSQAFVIMDIYSSAKPDSRVEKEIAEMVNKYAEVLEKVW